MEQKIIPRLIEEEMKQSYVDYAMSVIIGRALPDIRDGLKPVHRRILFAMNDMGLLHNKPFKKSANVVGTVLGKYHPHGDSSVYDALVRLAQDFSLRYPLVDGQGNWGSIDGDAAAAYRYTEVRLKKIAEELLADIEKETVDFGNNFDGTLKEPVVLPSKIPNLLINGSSGIAVGMATNIPPHNISEICDALILQISNPNVQLKDLMQFIRGPDFPTGGIILGKSGIIDAYSSGRGKIIVMAKTTIEDHKTKKAIVVKEIPYQVNKSAMIEEIANLVKEKKIIGISDIRDESDREGMRIVLELKKDANPEVVLNQLYSHTNMRTTFGVIMLALVDNEPKILSLRDILEKFIEHRKNVIKRRTQFDLKKAEEKLHVLEGLIVALNNIEPVVEKIKKSKDAEIAKQMLMKDYSLSEIQAKSIFEMRLQR
ncbi:MAG: DNA topoisomerase (ATP-hydrolyzing), partial [Candidatus Woesearchaeota archaeon]